MGNQWERRPVTEKAYTASLFPRDAGTIPTGFAESVLKLEADYGKPIWLLVQRCTRLDNPFATIDEPVRTLLFSCRREIAGDKGAVLLVDSPGGSARSAYQISSLFRRQTGSFTAVVPRYAKSAATLLVLGAEAIVMAGDAELGPLDAQIYDADNEVWGSALDEVQALERLNSAALDQVDQAMFLLLPRTRKKIETLLPPVMRFVSDMMCPMVSKIDTVHYTQRSRVLKVAEDYATRLLQPKFSQADAERIARALVNSYPEHDFVIDKAELSTLLKEPSANSPNDDVLEDLADILTSYDDLVAVGRVEELKEVKDDEPDTEEDADGGDRGGASRGHDADTSAENELGATKQERRRDGHRAVEGRQAPKLD